ncbi:MAG TPA: hypothetical protein VNQ73_20055 [Ilumatobacter sp.]|nr:hypothetical protein [Ilumatobacter sp.]
MPHVTIEYSANVAEHHDIDGLVAAVHAEALGHALVAPDALRTRAAPRAAFRVADGHPANAFVAIHVRIAPGRAHDDKRRLIEGLLAAAERYIESSDVPEQPLAIAWSIELTELDPELRINHNRVRDRMQEHPT